MRPAETYRAARRNAHRGSVWPGVTARRERVRLKQAIRDAKRTKRHKLYAVRGLNGPRARARRRGRVDQMEAA